jgi:hypothetical protein
MQPTPSDIRQDIAHTDSIRRAGESDAGQSPSALTKCGRRAKVVENRRSEIPAENGLRSPPLFPAFTSFSEISFGKTSPQTSKFSEAFQPQPPLFRFFQQLLGFTASRIPSQREKMPVTMRPDKKGQ